MNRRLKYHYVNSILECSRAILEQDSDGSDDELVIEMLNLGKTALLFPERPKRLWVKQWREDRLQQGAYAFLTKKLKLDPPSYTNYLRLNEIQFNDLLALIRNDIKRTDTVMRDAVTPAEKLSVTLRFLATGESFQSLSYNTRLSPAFICGTVPQVCKAIIKNLAGKYLKVPNCTVDWEAISMEFAVKWQFPNCLGALDGKHINFRPPRNDGAFFHNYKGANSIILLALVDANCRFIFVDIGCNGRTNDAGALLQSPLKKILDEGKNLPQNTLVGRERCLPHVVLGDDAFPLQKHILKPYPYHTNNTKKRVFNIRLSRARHVVEHAFGILANRFRVFQTIINLKVETVDLITFASCVLHNFLLAIDSTYINSCEVIEKEGDGENSHGPYNPRKGEAENIRQQFMAYFNEEGEVDWQYSKL